MTQMHLCPLARSDAIERYFANTGRRHAQNDEHGVEAMSMNDDEIRTAVLPMQKMEPEGAQPDEVIPSPPGWYVLTGIMDEADRLTGPYVALSKEPIIAWRITRKRSATGETFIPPPEPITAEGSSNGGLGLLQPNGCVLRIG